VEALNRAASKFNYISVQGDANYAGFNMVAKMNADDGRKQIDTALATYRATQTERKG
jgi:hypothetical protein